MACVTHPEVARICVEINISKPIRRSFWIGPPRVVTNHFQEVVYESLPMLCSRCRMQEHQESKCGRSEREQKGKMRVMESKDSKEKLAKVWKSVGVREPEKPVVEVVGVKPSRREVILEGIKQRGLEGATASSKVFYVDGCGLICDHV